jgi:3-phenylpropionate/trans-cinnamate dioxygenase ferredoxin subunit
MSTPRPGPESRRREPAGKKVVLARAADVSDGERLIVTVNGRSIGIFNVAGRFYAFLNRCPHRGAQLCKGDIVGQLESDRPGEFRLDPERRFLACPWHGWEFDLETGESWFDPARTKARPFRVDVETGEIVSEELAAGRALELGEDMADFIDPKTRRIRGPYRAEALPVAVEDDYLVLSLGRRAPESTASAAVGKGE